MSGDATDAQATRSEPPSLLGRGLYGGVLASMAVDGFRNNEKRVDAARESGVPYPEHTVPFVTGMLLVANLGILAWKYPRVSAGAVVLFFVGTTPVIHNYWAMEGKERHNNRINFLKNLALLGGAIVFLAEADRDA